MFKVVLRNYPKFRTIGLYNKKEFNFVNSFLPMLHFFIVKTGSLTFHSVDHIFTVSEGDYAFIKESDNIDLSLTQASDDVVFYYLTIHSTDMDILDDTTFFYSSSPSFVINTTDKIINFQQAKENFKGLIEEYKNSNLIGCMGYFSFLFNDISQSIGNPKIPAKDYLVNKIVHFIHYNFQRQISLDELCQLTNASSTYINNLFRKHKGCTVMNYLNNHRIEIAKSELDKGKKTMDEIAKFVGFNYTSHFCRVFKKITGVTPTEYYQNNHYNYHSNFTNTELEEKLNRKDRDYTLDEIKNMY